MCAIGAVQGFSDQTAALADCAQHPMLPSVLHLNAACEHTDLSNELLCSGAGGLVGLQHALYTPLQRRRSVRQHHTPKVTGRP